MNPNPYERRREPRDGRDAGVMVHGGTFSFGMPGQPRQSLLRIEDLEAMVAQAQAREQRRLSEIHAEEMRNAQRKAWDEGHAVGRRNGQTTLLRSIDQQHGMRVRETIEAAGALLGEIDGRPMGEVDPWQLRARLKECHKLLSDLVDAHHREFREDLP